MPYVFGGLVLLNTLSLGYYLFVQETPMTDSFKAAQREISQPLSFTNSAKYTLPAIGSKD